MCEVGRFRINDDEKYRLAEYLWLGCILSWSVSWCSSFWVGTRFFVITSRIFDSFFEVVVWIWLVQWAVEIRWSCRPVTGSWAWNVTYWLINNIMMSLYFLLWLLWIHIKIRPLQMFWRCASEIFSPGWKLPVVLPVVRKSWTHRRIDFRVWTVCFALLYHPSKNDEIIDRPKVFSWESQQLWFVSRDKFSTSI